MQSLLELIEYLPPEIETVVAAPYDPRQYRRVPERVRLEIVQPPKVWGGHGYIRLFSHQLGWYRVVRRLVKRNRPDMLHLNGLFFDCFGGAIAAKQQGMPVIAHARGFLVSRRLARRIVRYFDYHIAISQAVAQHLIQQGVPENRCVVIYDPIIAPDNLVPLRTPGLPPQVGMLGMLQRWKGQHIFIEALHYLRQRDVTFRAAIAGTEPFGPQGYEQLLRDMARRYRLDDALQFTGFVANPFDFLRRMDIAVHASIEPEPLGRVVAEAMLADVPVIGTHGGGVPEMIIDGETGLLVPMGDARAMAEAIERLLKDEPLRRQLAEAGRRRAKEMFDPRKHAGEVIKVYERVLNTKHIMEQFGW
jgi:glycosyltransferase involved in cell wall biosynthesis